MLKEFKGFVLKGNVLDLAVAVIMGGAFGAVVTSLVNDVLMPPLGLLLGKVNFSNLFINLSGRRFDSLAAAKAAGAATINYGLFLNTIINLVIVGFAVFLIVRQASRLLKPVEAPPAPATKECPFCCSAIPVNAVRCGFCTSELK